MEADIATGGALRERVAAHDWYHTFELAPGLVTPGWFDLRPIVAEVPVPPSLAGKRCLDVGSFDGFWAFEMERRGADEVVAIDILQPERWDWPAGSDEATAEAMARRKAHGKGFELVHDHRSSTVTRRELSVYDLDPAVHGRFDLVYLGSLLLHLRDPVGALMAVRRVCAGALVVVDAIDPAIPRRFRRRPLASLDGVGRPWWWKPNEAALVRMVEAAGFAVTEGPKRIRMPAGLGQARAPLRPRTLLTRHGREWLRLRNGDPHAAIAARPL